MRSAELWPLLLSLLGGSFLGALYFGGLWWAVRRVADHAHPAPWFFSALLIRLGVAMGGFYLALRSGVGALLACLLGFVLARAAVVRRTRPALPSLEAGHAP